MMQDEAQWFKNQSGVVVVRWVGVEIYYIDLLFDRADLRQRSNLSVGESRMEISIGESRV